MADKNADYDETEENTKDEKEDDISDIDDEESDKIDNKEFAPVDNEKEDFDSDNQEPEPDDQNAGQKENDVDTTDDEDMASDDESVDNEDSAEDSPEKDTNPENVDAQETEEQEETQQDRPQSNEDADEGMTAKKIKKIFARTDLTKIHHPIFSSPYARSVAEAVITDTPDWYQVPNTNHIYDFKCILKCVENGRNGRFPINRFVQKLRDLDESVTQTEVLKILQGMDKKKRHTKELDFGEFIFYLAYQRDPDSLDTTRPDIQEYVSERQSIFLSVMSFLVTTTSAQDLETYYFQRRTGGAKKSDLKEKKKYLVTDENHYEAAQLEISRSMRPVYDATLSPYALPLSIVYDYREGKKYKYYRLNRGQKPRKDSILNDLTRPLFSQEKEKEMLHLLDIGSLPVPKFQFSKKVKAMFERGNYTAELMAAIELKNALDQKFVNKSKEDAEIIYARSQLKTMLKRDYPTEEARVKFVDIYRRYFRLFRTVEVKNIQRFDLEFLTVMS